MGFVLSVLYFITYYLTPPTIFGPLAAYRIELILAGLLFLVSLPRLTKSFVWRTPQTLALVGLAFAAFLSAGVQWVHEGFVVFFGFLPNPLAYFVVCLHCDSKKKLQIIALILLFVCLFIIVHGYLELRTAPTVVVDSAESEDTELPYLYGSGSLYRLRGLGEINDPNDFGQVVVSTIPLMFLFWTPKKTFRNIGTVIVPVCVLLYGAYLTHSRGSMLAILTMTILVVRRRIRTLPALAIGGMMYVGAMALNYTGGRSISAASGEDRTALWGASMELLKEHPLFGVGFGNLADYIGMTAHNSVMVCVGELGLVGLFFWCLFLFPTVRDAITVASPEKTDHSESISALRHEPIPQSGDSAEESEKTDIKRLGRLVVLSLAGFLVTSWFLSRAYILTLFLLGGMAEVVFEMAVREGIVLARLPLSRVLRNSGLLAVSLLVAMYVLLRVVNLTH